jgi:hypothetical protein
VEVLQEFTDPLGFSSSREGQCSWLAPHTPTASQHAGTSIATCAQDQAMVPHRKYDSGVVLQSKQINERVRLHREDKGKMCITSIRQQLERDEQPKINGKLEDEEQECKN